MLPRLEDPLHAVLVTLGVAVVSVVTVSAAVLGLLTLGGHRGPGSTPATTGTSAPELPPARLAVTEPATGSHTTEATVLLRGTADPGASITVVTSITNVRPDGTWSLALDLAPGPNRMTVRARLAGRRDSSATIDLVRDPVSTATIGRRRHATATTTTAPTTSATDSTTTTAAPGGAGNPSPSTTVDTTSTSTTTEPTTTEPTTTGPTTSTTTDTTTTSEVPPATTTTVGPTTTVPSPSDTTAGS